MVLKGCIICLVPSVFSGAVQLNSNNFDDLVASHEVVFLNFYADWCRFSQILAPIFDETADKINAEFPEKGKALIGKVDCDNEQALGKRFHISKYPTLKLIRQGFLAKREFRGQRAADAFVTYIREQLQDPVKQIKTKEELDNIDQQKRNVIAYFQDVTVPTYDVYRRVAMNLRDDCDFYIAFGDGFNDDRLGGEKIVFRSPFIKISSEEKRYTESASDFRALNLWITNLCIPLVREITFENAEEFTEEGLPFLILFHHPDDREIVEKYNNVIYTQLASEKAAVNYLTADGLKFAHPLHHLGKALEDLPVIAIDSFRHMYLFSDVKQMTVPGKLKEFIDDLYSGKLHREYHYGPDPTPDEVGEKESTTPPESTFKKLAPSRNRYTLLRDEL
uniref:Thioredoxin domain-containing protein n=1 Tax=Strigamia maritima TaxID=126957 RepID=T1J2G5_STRMM